MNWLNINYIYLYNNNKSNIMQTIPLIILHPNGFSYKLQCNNSTSKLNIYLLMQIYYATNTLKQFQNLRNKFILFLVYQTCQKNFNN